jgi:RNA polymerase sigma factor (sigma-70 family)
MNTRYLRDQRSTCHRRARTLMDRDLENWFVRVILPHQAALTRYLRRLCKSADDVPDLRQETYIRVCESATNVRPLFPKTFLFTTARNLVIDKVRRERVVSIEYTQDGSVLDLSIDELTPERRLAARQDLQQLTRAFDALPEKTRSVIWLRRVAGLSQRQTAASLGIDESALEGRMTRGMRSLAKVVVVDRPMKTGTL